MSYSAGIALVAVASALALPALANEQVKKHIDKGSSSLEQRLDQPIEIGGEQRDVRVNVATFDPKTAGAWHVHPTPVYVYVLQGTLTVEAEGKEPRVIKAGDATAEDLNTCMRAVNYSDEPAKTVVFQINKPKEAFRTEEKTQ